MKCFYKLFIFLLTILCFSVVVMARTPEIGPVEPCGFGIIPLEENNLKIEKIDLVFDGSNSSNYEVMLNSKYIMRNQGDTKTVKIGLPFFSEEDLITKLSTIDFTVNGNKLAPKLYIGKSIKNLRLDFDDLEEITSDLVSEDFLLTDTVGKLYTISKEQRDVTITIESPKDNKIIYSGLYIKKYVGDNQSQINVILTKEKNEIAIIYDATGAATITLSNGSYDVSEMDHNEYINYIIGESFHKVEFVSYAKCFQECKNGLQSLRSLLYNSSRMIILEYEVEILGENVPNEIIVNYMLPPTEYHNYKPYMYQYDYIHFHNKWDYYGHQYQYDVDLEIIPHKDIKYLLEPKFDFINTNNGYHFSTKRIGYEDIQFQLCASATPKIKVQTDVVLWPFICIFIGFVLIVLALPFMVYYTVKQVMRKRYSF